MNKKESLLIIIVTFNSESQIDICLESIFKSKTAGTDYKVVVVDNNSEDSTVKKIKSKYQKNIKDETISIIQNRQNIGFSKAVNLCLKNKKFDYYLLLNPDMYVLEDTIVDAITLCKDTGSSIVGVSTSNENGSKSGSYFRFPNLCVGIFDFTNLRKLSRSDYWHKYFYYEDLDTFPTHVDVVTGGFMLIKRSVVERIGGMDESFFMYLEDVDYCLRATIAGFKLSVVEKSIVHIGGASSSNREKTNHKSWIRSRKIYYFKHHSLLSNIIIQPLFLIDDIIIAIMHLFKS